MKVVFAEGDKDFVDIMFSFLTLPMTAIIRLLGENLDSKSVAIGNLSNLYDGLANLDPKYFWKEEYCKDMLLHPENEQKTDCRKLKINIDDTHPTKYYVCGKCWHNKTSYFYSTYKSARCTCGELMTSDVCRTDSKDYRVSGEGGVFVTDTVTYIVTDDLSIMPNSPSSILKLLNDLEIKDMRVLEERTANVGFKEILKLLECTLSSKSPLTDVFFCKPIIVKTESRNSVQPQLGITTTRVNSKMLTLKVLVNKSDKMVLFAEAGEDFIDFLFSFLAKPLGSVGYLLSGETCIGSIDNLYRSLSSLNVGGCLKTDTLKSMLRDVWLRPYYSCSSQLLPHSVLKEFTVYTESFTNVSSECRGRGLNLVDLRSGGGGFIRAGFIYGY